MKLSFPAMIVIGMLASQASAASLLVDSTPTVDLEGYRTYTLSIESFEGESFRGFDAGFSGSMNQVNPFGLATIFTDNNVVFPAVGADVSQDSQFLFASSDVLTIGLEESATSLQGAFSGLVFLDRPNPKPFAQIVTNDPYGVEVSIETDHGAGSLVRRGTLGDLACLFTSILNADLSIESAPAEGLPGQQTYTVWMDVSTNYDQISVDASFSGMMHQAVGVGPTAFQSDAPADQRSNDSHFLFDRDGLAIDAGVIELDTPDTLEASFAFPTQRFAAERVALAQITTGDPSGVEYNVSLEVCENLEPIVFSGRLVPEPHSLTLLLVVLLSVSRRNSRV